MKLNTATVCDAGHHSLVRCLQILNARDYIAEDESSPLLT